ncbi:MAG: hypothetical protein NT099_00590 [Candidatus Saganbacteria bacterium]|nr:hypothetical protein [Candidatus Saganbacteria bacterium]
MAQMYWVRHANNPVWIKIPKELREMPFGKGVLGDLQGKSLDDYQAGAVQGGWSSFVGRGIPTTLTTVDRITPFTLGQMTQQTFGMVAYFGGANGLGMKTYEQPWVVLHKDLGRGELAKVLSMPSGVQCAQAMQFFQSHFALAA